MPKPPGHKPKFDAFTTRFPDATNSMVFAQFGVRGPDGKTLHDALHDLHELLGSSSGPIHVDRTINVSTDADYEYVVLAYWDDDHVYEKWWTSPDVASRWDRTDVIGLGRVQRLKSRERDDRDCSPVSKRIVLLSKAATEPA